MPGTLGSHCLGKEESLCQKGHLSVHTSELAQGLLAENPGIKLRGRAPDYPMPNLFLLSVPQRLTSVPYKLSIGPWLCQPKLARIVLSPYPEGCLPKLSPVANVLVATLPRCSCLGSFMMTENDTCCDLRYTGQLEVAIYALRQRQAGHWEFQTSQSYIVRLSLKTDTWLGGIWWMNVQ